MDVTVTGLTLSNKDWQGIAGKHLFAIEIMDWEGFLKIRESGELMKSWN